MLRPVWDTPATFSLLLLVLGLRDWLFMQGPQNPHEYDHDDELHHCLGQYCGLHEVGLWHALFFEPLRMPCHIRGYTPENPCTERKDDVEQYPANKILGRFVDATCSRKHCQDLYMQIFRYKHIY